MTARRAVAHRFGGRAPIEGGDRADGVFLYVRGHSFLDLLLRSVAESEVSLKAGKVVHRDAMRVCAVRIDVAAVEVHRVARDGKTRHRCHCLDSGRLRRKKISGILSGADKFSWSPFTFQLADVELTSGLEMEDLVSQMHFEAQAGTMDGLVELGARRGATGKSAQKTTWGSGVVWLGDR